jgi:dTDP-4-dehydrorhamnose reductase
VIAIDSSEFPTPAVRPPWSLLDNRGFQQHFDFPLPDWQHGVGEVISLLVTSGS